MGAGSATVQAAQATVPARSQPPPGIPSIATSLARLDLQLGDRQKVQTLLAELAEAIEEMRQGGPLKLQINVRPDERPPTQPKVAGVSIQRDERLW